MSPALIVVAAAVAMEPVAAVLHRLVMHGVGWGWHRSHHRPPTATFERNDLFPVVLAAATVAVMAAGSAVASFRGLLWAGTGVTLYGLAYLVVHDMCLHGRVAPVPAERLPYLRWVREAHRVHHLFRGAPYGFLCPVVPATLRKRAARTGRDPLADARRGAGTKAAATVTSFSEVGTRTRLEKTS